MVSKIVSTSINTTGTLARGSVQSLILIIVLGGCTSSMLREQAPVSSLPTPTISTMPVPEQPGQATQKSETTNPAVLSLQNASASARASDNLPQAIAYIERALRIDAQRMGLWLELAQLHLESLNFSNAEQVARKALTFKQESSEQISIAWLIIATCLEASGDSAQAQDIRDYVVTLSAGV